MAYLKYNGQMVQSGNKYATYFIDPNKLIGWSNSLTVPYDTLTTSGRDISHAIEAPGTFARCFSNEVEIEGYDFVPPGAGGSYITIDITWLSGTGDVQLHMYKDGTSEGWTTITYAGPGPQTKLKADTIFETGVYSYYLYSPNTGIDFKIENAVWTVNNGTPP